MVDVNIHKCFPTTIYEFNYEPTDKNLMESYIKQSRKNHSHTLDDLHELSYFMNLREKVYEVSKQYLNDLEYEYEKLEITGMWANVLYEGSAQANVLRPRNKTNWDNASMVQFPAIQSSGYIFPSWLQHWVPPTEDERISVSWNILLRGDYGEQGTLQNAYI